MQTGALIPMDLSHALTIIFPYLQNILIHMPCVLISNH